MMYMVYLACVYAQDIENAIKFYWDILGFQVIRRERRYFEDYAMMTLNGSRLELIQPNEMVKGAPLLSAEVEDNNAPMGELRVIHLSGPSQEHLNLYE